MFIRLLLTNRPPRLQYKTYEYSTAQSSYYTYPATDKVGT